MTMVIQHHHVANRVCVSGIMSCVVYEEEMFLKLLALKVN